MLNEIMIKLTRIVFSLGTGKRKRKIWGEIEISITLLGYYHRTNAFVKTQQTAYLRSVQFIICFLIKHLVKHF